MNKGELMYNINQMLRQLAKDSNKLASLNIGDTVYHLHSGKIDVGTITGFNTSVDREGEFDFEFFYETQTTIELGEFADNCGLYGNYFISLDSCVKYLLEKHNDMLAELSKYKAKLEGLL